MAQQTPPAPLTEMKLTDEIKGALGDPFGSGNFAIISYVDSSGQPNAVPYRPVDDDWPAVDDPDLDRHVLSAANQIKRQHLAGDRRHIADRKQLVALRAIDDDVAKNPDGTAPGTCHREPGMRPPT